MTVKFTRDPDSVLDYEIDWSKWLVTGDRIISSTMTPDSPSLTVKSQSYTDQTTTVWVSGGVAGDVHNILNHIITAAGREEDQTLQFKMKEQ